MPGYLTDNTLRRITHMPYNYSTHPTEEVIISDNNIRIISLLLLLPLYSGVDVLWSVFNKIIYPISLALVLLALAYKGKFPRLSGTNNVFALFLFYTVLAVVFDFRHGTYATFAGFNASKSWEALVTTLVSFLVITLRVTPREFLFSTIAGMVIFYLYRFLGILGMVDLGVEEILIFGKNAYAFVTFSAGLLLYIRGKRIFALLLILTAFFQSTRAEILAFAITIVLYHLNEYMQRRKVRTGKVVNYRLVKIMVIMALMGMLLTQIVAAFNIIGDSDFWQNITTGRSVFYFAILSQWLPRGIDIFYPAYPGWAAELATIGTSLLFPGQYSYFICPHSIVFEMMIDYGIVIGLSFTLLMVIMSKKKGIFATSFFLITMSTQCEAFSSFNFVTYLLVYRYLEMDPEPSGIKIGNIRKPHSTAAADRLSV